MAERLGQRAFTRGSTWRSSRQEGGGCLHDYASHVIDLMNFIVGPPEGCRIAPVTLFPRFPRP